MFFKCSVEGLVQLRNISLSYTYIVIVKHGCLCKMLFVFSRMDGGMDGWMDGWMVRLGGGLRGGLAPESNSM